MKFPESTKLHKRIPKQRFYENLSISNSLKRCIIEQISAVYWEYNLTASALNVSEGDKVSEIQIFHVMLVHEYIDENVLKAIDKGIPYHIIFILEYEKKCRFAAALKEINNDGTCFHISKYFYSDKIDNENAILKINGLSLDVIYESFIRQIAGNDLSISNGNLKDDIIQSEKYEKIKREIERLEKRAYKEKQPKRKFELAQTIKELKQELSLIN